MSGAGLLADGDVVGKKVVPTVNGPGCLSQFELGFEVRQAGRSNPFSDGMSRPEKLRMSAPDNWSPDSLGDRSDRS